MDDPNGLVSLIEWYRQNECKALATLFVGRRGESLNTETVNSLLRGIEQSKAGKVKSLGSFAPEQTR